LKKRGFSILELLIVIALLSLIALIFLMNFRNVNNNLPESNLTKEEQAFHTFFQTGRDNRNILWFREEGTNNQVTCVRIETMIGQGFLEEDILNENNWGPGMVFRIVIDEEGNLTYTDITGDTSSCDFEDVNISNAHQGSTDMNQGVLDFTNIISLYDFNVFVIDMDLTYHSLNDAIANMTLAQLFELGLVEPFNLRTGPITIANAHSAPWFVFSVTPISATQSRIGISRNPSALFLDSAVQFTEVYLLRPNGQRANLNVPCTGNGCTNSRANVYTYIDNAFLIDPGTQFRICGWCFVHQGGGCATATDIQIEPKTVSEYHTAIVEFEVNHEFFRFLDGNGNDIASNRITRNIDLRGLTGASISDMFNFNIRYRDEVNHFTGAYANAEYRQVNMLNSVKVTLRSDDPARPDQNHDIDPTSTVIISRRHTTALN